MVGRGWMCGYVDGWFLMNECGWLEVNGWIRMGGWMWMDGVREVAGNGGGWGTQIAS